MINLSWITLFLLSLSLVQEKEIQPLLRPVQTQIQEKEFQPKLVSGTQLQPKLRPETQLPGVTQPQPTSIPVDDSEEGLFHEWDVVAVCDGTKIVPVTKNMTITILPDTFGRDFDFDSQKYLVVLNTKWQSQGKLFWSEVKTNPPSGQKSLVAGYVYIKVEDSSAVMTYSEYPMDLTTYNFQTEHVNMVSQLWVLRKSKKKKASRIQLIEKLVNFESQIYSSPHLPPGVYSPENCQVNGGLHEEYRRHKSGAKDQE